MTTLVDYGAKVPLCVDVIVEGCHGCTVEGYALSYPDCASLMDVALLAEPFRRPDGTIDRTADDVGEVLGWISLFAPGVGEVGKYLRTNLLYLSNYLGYAGLAGTLLYAINIEKDD